MSACRLHDVRLLNGTLIMNTLTLQDIPQQEAIEILEIFHGEGEDEEVAICSIGTEDYPLEPED